MKDTVKAVLSGIGILIFIYLVLRWGNTVVNIITSLSSAAIGTIGALQGNAQLEREA